MDILRSALNVPPDVRAGFEREQRRWQENAARMIDRQKGAADHIARAEAKRARKRQRNLAIARAE